MTFGFQLFNFRMVFQAQLISFLMLLVRLSWKTVFADILVEKVKIVRRFVQLRCTIFIQEYVITLSLPTPFSWGYPSSVASQPDVPYNLAWQRSPFCEPLLYCSMCAPHSNQQHLWSPTILYFSFEVIPMIHELKIPWKSMKLIIKI